MTEMPTHGDERRRIETALVDLLDSMSLMQQPDSRQQMMNVLRQRLNHRVSLRDYPVSRQQCVEIATAWLSDPTVLPALVDVIAYITPAAPQLDPLERLRHEADVLDVLDPDDWSGLRAALEPVVPANPSRLYQRATGHQLSCPPRCCINAWHMFVHLSGQNAPPNGLAPAMVFLLLLEPETDSPTAGKIRRRNQRRATADGVTAELDQRRAIMNAGTDHPQPYVYLVIQVEPDFAPGSTLDIADSYTVSHYRQWQGADSWHSRRFGQLRSVPPAELESAVEEVVRQMEREWSDRRAEVVVELVLPIELINEDVPWWCKEKATAYLEKKVLAMDYPVVVRSLERLRQTDWHRNWRQRWHMLQAEPATNRLYRSQPAGADYFTALEAELSLDTGITTFLLSEPPTPDTPTGIQEIMTALRAGLPVIIWHRTRRLDTAFWEEICDMTANGGVARLPVHARKSRLAALRLEPAHREDHNGRHLAILWDDPERTPELNGSRGSGGEDA